MQKIKAFLQRKRGLIIAASVAAMCCVSAAAAEGDSSMTDITTALQTGFTQTAADILKVIAIAVVAVMSVVGVKVAVKSAIKFFKGMAGN